MPKPMIRIHNIETGEVVDREMTAAEFKQYEAEQANFAAKEIAENTKANEKAALLERLGMTADEAALLLS
jgi:hypothetical protein